MMARPLVIAESGGDKSVVGSSINYRDTCVLIGQKLGVPDEPAEE